MKRSKPIVAALVAAVAFTAMPVLCRASDAGDALSVVRKAGMAFNRGDLKGFAALCDSPAFVLDDFPPHVWSGSTACADWAAALGAFFKRNGLSNGTVAFGTPWQDVVTGDRAYVVVPATLHYNQKGRPVKESGSVLTVALKKTSSGWMMEGWSWSQHR